LDSIVCGERVLSALGCVVSSIAFLPGVPRCDTCDVGVAVMVIDSVWVCEECCEVLGVSPAAMRASEPVRASEPRKARSPSQLLEVIEAILKDEK
jgi:hypothetical protein